MVDGKTGKLITKEGRGIVGDDTEGKEFPWPQKMPLDVLPGPLLTKEDKEIEWSDVTEEIIGLYFSAQWVSLDTNYLVYYCNAWQQDFTSTVVMSMIQYCF